MTNIISQWILPVYFTIYLLDFVAVNKINALEVRIVDFH